MCGLFGYYGPGADPSRLKEIARLAARRGPEGLGLAFQNKSSRPSFWIEFGSGATVRHINLIDRCADAQVVIGHCRLASSNVFSQGLSQPVTHGGVVLAHNGNVPGYREDPDWQWGDDAPDSRLLALWVGKQQQQLNVSLAEAWAAVSQRLNGRPYAVLIASQGEFLAAARGLPLWTDGNGYYGSVRWADDLEAVGH